MAWVEKRETIFDKMTKNERSNENGWHGKDIMAVICNGLLLSSFVVNEQAAHGLWGSAGNTSV